MKKIIIILISALIAVSASAETFMARNLVHKVWSNSAETYVTTLDEDAAIPIIVDTEKCIITFATNVTHYLRTTSYKDYTFKNCNFCTVFQAVDEEGTKCEFVIKQFKNGSLSMAVLYPKYIVEFNNCILKE